MLVEDSPQRWRWSQRNRARIVGVLLWLALAVALVATADVTWLRCERARDRCDFASYTLLAEAHEGDVSLSSVNYLVDTVSVTRFASRRTLSRAQLRFVMTDGRSVNVEPESRTAFISDWIIEDFKAFRLERQPVLERWALHLGHGGFAGLMGMFIGVVLVIVGLEREIELDFVRRTMRVRVAGPRVAPASFECSLDDVAGIEVVSAGPMVGLWLLLRSGRRVQLDFESTSFSTALAKRLGVALAPQSSEVVAKGGAVTRRAGAVALALFGAAPVLLAAAWPFVERLL